MSFPIIDPDSHEAMLFRLNQALGEIQPEIPTNGLYDRNVTQVIKIIQSADNRCSQQMSRIRRFDGSNRGLSSNEVFNSIEQCENVINKMNTELKEYSVKVPAFNLDMLNPNDKNFFGISNTYKQILMIPSRLQKWSSHYGYQF
jgi:hypothetical protein